MKIKKKHLPEKYALSVNYPFKKSFYGEKNGKKIGQRLSTVVKDVV